MDWETRKDIAEHGPRGVYRDGDYGGPAGDLEALGGEDASVLEQDGHFYETEAEVVNDERGVESLSNFGVNKCGCG